MIPLVEKVMEYKAKKAELWPVKSNRASEMGHPCVRYLVFNRTRWQEKALPSAELQMIFDLGIALEPVVLEDLRKAGIHVQEQQRAFEWKEYQITGSIDAVIIADHKAYPLEVKTCSPYVFNAINSAEDMTKSRYLYMRKYPTQLTLYMLMKEKEEGVWIFKNKVNGAMKEIWMPLDYALGEETLKRAEAVNAHLAAGTNADPLPWDESICGECPFLHICLPEVNRSELEMLDTPELIMMLDRRAELASIVKEYNELDTEIKKSLEGREKVAVGDWLITGKMVQRKGYEVKASEYWQTTIKRV